MRRALPFALVCIFGAASLAAAIAATVSSERLQARMPPSPFVSWETREVLGAWLIDVGIRADGSEVILDGPYGPDLPMPQYVMLPVPGEKPR